MKPSPLLLAALLFTQTASVAQEKFASPASEIFATHKPEVTDRSPAARAAAANAFLESLTEKLRAEAALPMDSPERQKWTNVPPRGVVGGVRLGDCDKKQLKKAATLLETALSANGFATARDIMIADDQLLKNFEPRAGFGGENFWLAIFGKPSATEPWAIQFDGHHVAINATYAGEKVSFSPSFIGTQPKSIKLDGKEIVVMGPETKRAFALVNALDRDQQSKAVVTGKRGRMIAGANADGKIPEIIGIPVKELNGDQKKKLSHLIYAWVDDLPKAAADARMKEIEAEFDEMHFGWNGPTKEGSDMSYRIQSPGLIIEYTCQDLGGDPLNHLHSIYRNPKNEYGVAILK